MPDPPVFYPKTGIVSNFYEECRIGQYRFVSNLRMHCCSLALILGSVIWSGTENFLLGCDLFMRIKS
ncbi:hypothetical protein C9939_03795 [Pseudidiomarina aestuarii]|nr:hypothetical protein C9939_03795 [Pseudidiomarina aestuarii]